MKEYKRLTKRRKDGSVALDFYSNSKDFTIVELKLRLAELEDKIEAGTLVTVPYAIGQEVYWVDKKGYFDVEKVKVSLITIKHDGSVDIRLNHYRTGGNYSGCFKYDPKYYELFDNEAEAEKRLEEIRNGNNDKLPK